jgi:hypothetical protein
MWWPAGLALAAAYVVFSARRYGGRVSIYRDK